MTLDRIPVHNEENHFPCGSVRASELDHQRQVSRDKTARKAAIWHELHALFDEQERRADREHALRAAEHAREMELRAELNSIDGESGDITW
jgi:hypothetical protein